MNIVKLINSVCSTNLSCKMAYFFLNQLKDSFLLIFRFLHLSPGTSVSNEWCVLVCSNLLKGLAAVARVAVAAVIKLK